MSVDYQFINSYVTTPGDPDCLLDGAIAANTGTDTIVIDTLPAGVLAGAHDFDIAIENPDGIHSEAMHVTSIGSSPYLTWTVEREYAGTVASSHNDGASIRLVILAEQLTAAYDNVPDHDHVTAGGPVTLGDLDDVDVAGVAPDYVLARNATDDGYEFVPANGGGSAPDCYQTFLPADYFPAAPNTDYDVTGLALVLNNGDYLIGVNAQMYNPGAGSTVALWINDGTSDLLGQDTSGGGFTSTINLQTRITVSSGPKTYQVKIRMNGGSWYISQNGIVKSSIPATSIWALATSNV